MSRPATLTRSLWAHAALVALGVAATVLVRLLRDDLVVTWAQGGSGRLAALEAGDIDAPAFVPVAVVLCVVVVSLIWVLCSFVGHGYGWARLVLTGTVVFVAVATIAGIRTAPPTTFVVIGLVSFVIEAVALGLLWHRDTTAWIRGSWRDESDVVDASA